jgi:hypothetical protein
MVFRVKKPRAGRVPGMALVVALVLAGCGPNAVRPVASPVAHPSPSVRAVAATPSSAPAAPPIAAPALSAVAPGVHRGASVAPPAAGMPPMATPAPGTYPADETSSGASPGKGSLLVQKTSTPGSFDIDIRTSQGSEDNLMAWRADGVYLVSTRLASGTGPGADCTWDPSILDLQLPLATGQQWSSSSSCTVASATGSGTVQEQTVSRISGTSTVTVGATTVPVYTVDSTTRLTFTTGASSFSSTTVSTAWLAPAEGLVVKVVQETTNDSTGRKTDSTFALTSLTPS